MLRYSNLVDGLKKLNENGGAAIGMVGAVTAPGNPSVTYLPGSFSSVRNYLHSLTPLKKQWGLETIDEKENYRLRFENALDIVVPKTFYTEFDENVLKVKGKTKVDLMESLNEDIRQQINAGFKRVEQLLINGLKKKPSIMQSIVLVETFLRLFPRSKFLPKESNVLFGLNTYNQDVREAIEYVKRLYGDELGKLEALIEALETNKPLNTIAPFSHFEYVVGALLKTDFEGIELTLDIGVNMSLRSVQSIHVEESSNVLEEIQAIKSIKVVQNSIVPVGPVLTPRDLLLVKKIIDDVVSTKGKK